MSWRAPSRMRVFGGIDAVGMRILYALGVLSAENCR